MSDSDDISLIINSHVPIVVIESHEELRVLKLVSKIAWRIAKPVFKWSITEGLERLDREFGPQKHNTQPTDVLRHIKSVTTPGVYILTDFHPYLKEPVHIRLLKDIAIEFDNLLHTIILVSHQLDLPPELHKFSARAQLALPSREELEEIVRDIANEWSQSNAQKAVKTDPQTLKLLINNLAGLTKRDAERLARKAIYDDGAITQSDLPEVMKAKYSLLSQDGILHFEFDTSRFAHLGGFRKMKDWLEQRKEVFYHQENDMGLDAPKGVLLLGVQGCGKSLAAKAIAGAWGIPLLRLDFGSIYNKFHGESERNLRESLITAVAMAPCVLWIDEIEKGISSESHDGGTSKRILGTLLTWMAEKHQAVFIVATANDIESLPPELVRKGRFDEIFFVDLPKDDVRKAIFRIHLEKRKLDAEAFDLNQLVQLSHGFSGAEIEQVVVSALYKAYANKDPIEHNHLVSAIKDTKPLSVTMAEKIRYLRTWAADRTVSCD